MYTFFQHDLLKAWILKLDQAAAQDRARSNYHLPCLFQGVNAYVRRDAGDSLSDVRLGLLEREGEE